jgi:hypothetical protein
MTPYRNKDQFVAQDTDVTREATTEGLGRNRSIMSLLRNGEEVPKPCEEKEQKIEELKF